MLYLFIIACGLAFGFSEAKNKRVATTPKVKTEKIKESKKNQVNKVIPGAYYVKVVQFKGHPMVDRHESFTRSWMFYPNDKSGLVEARRFMTQEALKHADDDARVAIFYDTWWHAILARPVKKDESVLQLEKCLDRTVKPKAVRAELTSFKNRDVTLFDAMGNTIVTFEYYGPATARDISLVRNGRNEPVTDYVDLSALRDTQVIDKTGIVHHMFGYFG